MLIRGGRADGRDSRGRGEQVTIVGIAIGEILGKVIDLAHTRARARAARHPHGRVRALVSRVTGERGAYTRHDRGNRSRVTAVANGRCWPRGCAMLRGNGYGLTLDISEAGHARAATCPRHMASPRRVNFN